MPEIFNRPRRLRSTHAIRNLVAQNNLSVNDLIMPLFFKENIGSPQEIKAMPGQYRYSLDGLVDKVKELEDHGVQSIALFPCIEESKKFSDCREATNPENINLQAIRKIKEQCPDIMIMSDIALDPYNLDGHDGIVNSTTGEVENDSTCEILARMALQQAQAGADILGPSDMMDARIGVIRRELETHKYINTLIMAYTAKYASSYYGPFRNALDSAPKAGDKKSYQMDFRNSDEALKEMYLDLEEGADIIMVKPGLPYLDIVRLLSDNTNQPIAAYNVSGEYSMLMSAANAGYIDLNQAIVETLTSFKRAGASIVLSYFTEYFAKELNK